MMARIMGGAAGPVEVDPVTPRHISVAFTLDCGFDSRGENDAASSCETLARRPHAAVAEGARCGLRLGPDRLRDGGIPGCTGAGRRRGRRPRIPPGVGRRRGADSGRPHPARRERRPAAGRRASASARPRDQAGVVARPPHPSGDVGDRGAGEPPTGDTASRSGGCAARCRLRRVAGCERVRPARHRGRRRSMPSTEDSGSGRCNRSPPSIRLSSISTSARTSLRRWGRIVRSTASPTWSGTRRLAMGPISRRRRWQGRWYFVFRRAWGDCPSRMHRPGAVLLHGGRWGGRADRTRARARHGILRGPRRQQRLALARLSPVFNNYFI